MAAGSIVTAAEIFFVANGLQAASASGEAAQFRVRVGDREFLRIELITGLQAEPVKHVLVLVM
jgi:hypothetical protein